jgi:hypothetical protein
MNDQDMDKLLEQGFLGDPPGQIFRARVLRDSTAALVHARRGRVRWRFARLSAAAVFIAAVSFLLGRYSAPQPAVRPAIADAGDTVAVPTDLVVWLDTARLFKQLGMEDRMGRALDRAGRLLPRDAIITDSVRERAFTADSEMIENQHEHVGPSRTPDLHQSVESMNRIMAQSFGGYSHASEMD